MTFSKRLFDLILALLMGLVLVPVIGGLALWLLLKEGRPVFYVSKRMKSPTQPFAMIKFRTMTVVTEDQGVSGAHKKSRITARGAWLRKRRLDELPQLYNILRGDLSFVGPRPPLHEYVERHAETYREVLKSRPGVTGLATIVYHRHEAMLLDRCHTPEETDRVYSRICVPAKARLDLIYQRRRSLCFDSWLIVRTIKGIFEK
ncbi:sugar transferase [Pseudophaeobacter sp.]|uniref:sugar transferase n=1 Tax=Pseudophaeobacter sp. TaxID=1971739 RepID=UPI00405A30ED